MSPSVVFNKAGGHLSSSVVFNKAGGHLSPSVVFNEVLNGIHYATDLNKSP